MRAVVGVLGGAWVRSSTGDFARARAGRQATLLSLLILHHGSTLSFDAVSDVLWPGRDLDSTRNSLRVQVSTLRRWLSDTAGPDVGPTVETRHGGYCLVVDPALVDTGELEAVAEDARRAVAAGELDLAERTFRSISKRWADPYPELVGYEPADSERWRLLELRELASDELFDVRIARGESRQVIGELEARVRQHPYRERTYGQLMQALYAEGRQAEALAAFQRARQVLVDELGVEPGPSLREVETSILTQAAIGTPGRAEVRRSTDRLVAREQELAVLAEAVGQQNLVVVSGPPGIGKTRLLTALTDDLPGTRSYLGTAARDNGAPPMWPVLSALGRTTVSWASDAAAEFRRNELLLHDLRSVPSVLVLDDFQWADEATVRFVQQALAPVREPGLCVVLALRDAPVDADSVAGRAAAELVLRQGATEVRLPPFDLAGIEALIDSHPASSLEASEILQRSGGNPLFVLELLRLGERSHDRGAAKGVAALLVDRLEGVTAKRQEILASAAILGDQVETSLLLRLGIGDDTEVMEALAAGHHLGLLETRSDGTVVFRHALLRDAMSDLLSDAERRRVHDAAATALASRASDSAHLQPRLANHAWESLPFGDAARAVRALMRAGLDAKAHFAMGDAQHHFERAEIAAEHLADAERGSVLPAVLCELGYSTVRSGATEAGTAVLRRAIDVARTAGDHESLAKAVRYLLEGRSPVALRAEMVIPLVEEAIAVTEGVVSEDRVQLLTDLAGLRYWTHDIADRRQLSGEALRLADELGEPTGKAIAAFGACTAINAPSTAQERLDLATSARRSARQAGSTDFSVAAATFEVEAAFTIGDLDRARRTLRSAAEELEGMDLPRLEWFVGGWSVVADVAAGDLDRAEAAATATLLGWDEGSHPDALACYGSQLSMIRLLQHRPAEVVDLLSGFLAEEPDHPLARAIVTYAHAMAGEAGCEQLVRDDIDRLAGGLRVDGLTLPILAMTVEAATHVEVDQAAAAELVALTEPWTALHATLNAFGGGGLYWGSMLHTHGVACALAGLAEPAREFLERAVAEHDRVEAPLFADRSKAALARWC